MDAPDQGRGLFIGVGLVRGQELSWLKKFSSLIVSREKKVEVPHCKFTNKIEKNQFITNFPYNLGISL